jgi:hypothetical protein
VAYATGKFSYGLCDYCGQRYPYQVLKKNWRGFKVCPEDYEPKEPQLEPLKYSGDAIALREPRPDRVEPVDVYVGQPGYTYFQSLGSANNVINMRPYPSQDTPHGVGATGSVRIEAGAAVVVSGISAGGQVGAVSAEGNSVIIPFVGSSLGTGEINSVLVTGSAPNIALTGVNATGGTNDATVDLVLNVPVSAVSGSGNISPVIVPNVSLPVDGIEGLGEVGDPSVTTT